MNLEICSSAQKSAAALGAMPCPLLQPIVLTQATASTDTVYYPSCLLIQDLFFCQQCSLYFYKAEITSSINCSIQLLKV